MKEEVEVEEQPSKQHFDVSSDDSDYMGSSSSDGGQSEKAQDLLLDMDDSTIIETSHVILPKEDISNFIDFLGDEEPEESMPECVYQDEEPI